MKTIFLTSLLLVSSCTLISSCGGGGSSSDTSVNTTNAENRCTLGSDLYKIMPIGDSITEGEEGHNTYRRNLWLTLTNLGCKIDFVGSKKGVKSSSSRNQTPPPNLDFDLDHEGYWGYEVELILPFIAARISTYQPDIVLVHLGTNDVFQGQSIASTIEELATLIDTMRTEKPNIKIFLAKVIPSHKANSQLTLLNTQIEILAKALNSETSPIILVDQNTGYSISDNYDGTHPNVTGEQKIADNWANAVLGSF